MHRRAVVKPNRSHSQSSLGDGETVEFRVVGTDKGPEASGVSGPGGSAVRGSVHARRRPPAQGPRPGALVSPGNTDALVTVCIATARAFCRGDLGRLRILLPKIFKENGLPAPIIPECFASDVGSTSPRVVWQQRPRRQQQPRPPPRKRSRLGVPLPARSSAPPSAVGSQEDIRPAPERPSTPPPVVVSWCSLNIVFLRRF